MRASRLISVLMLLQARGRLTAAQIAHELEVSIRTVYRDVQALQWAGVPVLGTAGPTGGIELMQGWRSRLTGLTADEAEALFLTGMPGPAADLGLHAAVSSAQRKIAASLPGELGRRARGAQDRFHFDAVGWYRDPDDAPHLGTVASAVFERRQIAVRYARWREPVEVDRVLDPYGIVLKAGLWYLVAASDGRPPHTYRISQVLQARVLETPSVRPDDFDLAKHWATYLADYNARLRPAVARVRLSAEGRAMLPATLGQAVAEAAAASCSAPDPAGWVVVEIPIESIDRAYLELLALGHHLEVLAPPDLRARLIRTAAELATLYGVA